VRLFGRAKAREHTHRPELAAVHGRLNAPGEGVFARHAQLALVIGAGRTDGSVGRSEDVGYVEAAPGLEPGVPRRHLGGGGPEDRAAPLGRGDAKALEIAGSFTFGRVDPIER